MPQPNDPGLQRNKPRPGQALSRSLVALDQNSTIIAVIEMSQSSWLVAGVLPGIERQPRKKLEPNAEGRLGLLHRWRDEAIRAGKEITRTAVAFEAKPGARTGENDDQIGGVAVDDVTLMPVQPGFTAFGGRGQRRTLGVLAPVVLDPGKGRGRIAGGDARQQRLLFRLGAGIHDGAGAVAGVHRREARHESPRRLRGIWVESGTSGARRSAVAPGGKVYAQNSEAAFARVKDRLDARLKTPAAANIVSVVRPFGSCAPGMHDFDLVTFFYAYHDITYLGVDHAKMNKALFDALKPGGELVVGDYSARPGAGTSVVQILHRSDEALVTSEIEAVGFKLIDHGDFLHVPGDARDAPSHSSAQPVDIYMLKFRKPGLTREKRWPVANPAGT